MLLDLWPAARQHPPQLGADPGSPGDLAMPPVENHQSDVTFYIDYRTAADPGTTGLHHQVLYGTTVTFDPDTTADADMPVGVALTQAGTPRHTKTSRRWQAIDDEDTLLALLARMT